MSDSEELKQLVKESPLSTVYRYYGTGDMGGSPTITSVRAVEKGVKGSGDIEVVSATSDQLYKDYAGKHEQLPVFDGELLMDVDSADTASQIVFAGIRFTLAGILVLIFASVREKKIMIPDREILKYAVPVCLAQTVGQYFFLLYRRCAYVRS